MYETTYRRSIEDPEGFWAEAAQAIDWDAEPEQILEFKPPVSRWFAGGRLNTCHNALDRHVAAGRGEQLALIYDSPVTDTVKRFTYAELRDDVARFAGGGRGAGGRGRGPGRGGGARGGGTRGALDPVGPEVVHGPPGDELILPERHAEVEVEVTVGGGDPGEAPSHALLVGGDDVDRRA
jgi:hypothetical protein